MKFSEMAAAAVALANWRAETRPASRGPSGPGCDHQPAADAARLADPPRCEELHRFLLTLPPPAVYLLAAVAYLGASELGPGQLVDVLLRVGRTFPKRAAVVDVLAGPVPLADYLGDGLRKLAAARVNLDKLHAG